MMPSLRSDKPGANEGGQPMLRNFFRLRDRFLGERGREPRYCVVDRATYRALSREFCHLTTTPWPVLLAGVEIVVVDLPEMFQMVDVPPVEAFRFSEPKTTAP
jgi:hypothetical protein